MIEITVAYLKDMINNQEIDTDCKDMLNLPLKTVIKIDEDNQIIHNDKIIGSMWFLEQ